MVRLEVLVAGMVVGAVSADTHMQAADKAVRYFPGCMGVTAYHRRDCDMEWVSSDKAIFLGPSGKMYRDGQLT